MSSIFYSMRAGRTPAKRSHDEVSSDGDEPNTSEVHRVSHNPFPLYRVKLAAVVPLAKQLGCSVVDAGERYEQMLDRLEKYLNDNNLMHSSTEQEKEILRQGLDTFFAIQDNGIILDQFTSDPSRKEALRAFLTNIRRNIKDNKNRDSKKESHPRNIIIDMPPPQPIVTPPPTTPLSSQLSTALYTTAPGLTIDSQFDISNGDAPGTIGCVTDAKDLLKNSEMESTLNADDLDFKMFLEILTNETPFDPNVHALFMLLGEQRVRSGLTPETASQPRCVLDERSWLRYIRLEAKGAGDFYYEFGEAHGSKYGHHIKPLAETMGGTSNIIERPPRVHDPVPIPAPSPAPKPKVPTREPRTRDPKPPPPPAPGPRTPVPKPTTPTSPDNHSSGSDIFGSTGTSTDSPVVETGDGDTERVDVPATETHTEEKPAKYIVEPQPSPDFDPYATSDEMEAELLENGLERMSKGRESDDDDTPDRSTTLNMLLDKNTSEAEHATLISQIGGSLIERLNQETLERCSRFYSIRMVDLCRRDTFSTLGGTFNISLRSHQLYAIFYLLELEITKKQTGFLCDAPGVGKTYVTMGLIVISKLFTDNQRVVRLSREKEDGKHLQEEDTGTCPSSSGSFFQCSCEKGSLAEQHKPTNGINVLVTMPAAVTKMLRDFKTLVPAKAKFRLYGDIQERTKLVDGVELWKPLIHVPRWGSDARFEPRKDAECVLLVTGHKNFSPLLVDCLESQKGSLFKPTKKKMEDHIAMLQRRENRKFTRKEKADLMLDLIPIHIGRIVADECHLYLTSNHSLIRFLLRVRDWIRVIPQTGTQLSNAGLRPIEQWLNVMWNHTEWNLNEAEKKAHPLYPRRVCGINDSYAAAVKKNDHSKMDEIISSLSNIMNKCNMIRRDNLTTWLDGQSIIICPPVKSVKHDLSIKRNKYYGDFTELRERHYGRWETDRKEEEEKTGEASKDTMTKVQIAMKKILLAATFPGVAPEFLKDKPDYSGNELSAPYTNWSETAAKLAKYSPKFKHFIRVLLRRWNVEYKEEKLKNPTAKHGKVLIFCQNPFTATMFYLALEKKFGKGAAYPYLSKTPAKVKEQTAKIFDTDEDKIASLGIEGQNAVKKAKFLCSTYAIASTAVDLRACTKVVLLEPSYHQKNEEQAICRAARTGQDQIVEVVRYTAIPEERIIAKRNDTVKRLVGLATRWSEEGELAVEEEEDLIEEEDELGGWRDSAIFGLRSLEW